MRYRPHPPGIKDRIIEELPIVAASLIDITGFTEKELTPIAPNSQAAMSATARKIGSSTLQGLEWADIIGKTTRFAGSSYTDTMRSVRILTLRSLLAVRDAEAAERYALGDNLAGGLLVATRGIIAHTPYPQAFRSNDYAPTNGSLLPDHIKQHSESYVHLLPFMKRSQARLTNQVLSRA